MKRRAGSLADLFRRSVSQATIEAAVVRHRPLVQRIEQLRRDFGATGRSVTFTDHGAPDSAQAEPSWVPGRRRTVTTGYLANTSSMQPDRLQVILSLVHAFRPRTLLELGTCVGISAAYLLTAMTGGSGGRLVSLEGSPELARLAEGNLRQLGLTSFEIVVGRHQDTLAPTVRRLAPVDFALIDGDHSESSTLRTHEQLSGSIGEWAVFLYDDIRWSPRMWRAWRRILDSDHRIYMAADLRGCGALLLRRGHGGNAELLRADLSDERGR